jgi:hypothetical protein
MLVFLQKTLSSDTSKIKQEHSQILQYFFLLFLARNFRKKTTQKNSASLQSLVRISNARADAHNTIAPPPHIQDPVTKN